MNTNKGSKKNMDQALDVCLEFMSSENWQMRLSQAFEMLVEGNDASSLTKRSFDSIIEAQDEKGMNK